MYYFITHRLFIVFIIISKHCILVFILTSILNVLFTFAKSYCPMMNMYLQCLFDEFNNFETIFYLNLFVLI